MTARKLTDAERVAFAAHQARGCTPRPTGCMPGAVEWWPLIAPRPWRDFYDGERYLGVSSGRTGPDACGAKQRCGCPQCTGPT